MLINEAVTPASWSSMCPSTGKCLVHRLLFSMNFFSILVEVSQLGFWVLGGVYFRLKLSWRRNQIQVAFHFLTSALTIILRDQWLRRWFPKMKATQWMISTKTKLTNPSLETTVLCKQLHTKNNKNTATRVGCTHLKGDMTLAYIRTTLQVFL